MAAIEKHHRGAGAVVFALVDHQVGVRHLDGNLGAFASDCVKQRRADVHVERVAEFVRSRDAAGFDGGGEVASVVAAKAAAAKGAEQVLQGLEAEKIDRFIRDFEARLGLAFVRLAELAACGSVRRRRDLRRLPRIDESFVGEALGEFVEKVLHRLAVHGCGILQHFPQLFAHGVFGEEVAFLERAKNGLAEGFHGTLGIHLRDAVELRLKPALGKEIAQPFDEFFQVDSVSRFADVFAVTDEFHDSRLLIIGSSIELSARWTWRSFTLALVGLPRFFRVEAALFAASDAAVRPQAFKNHFSRGCGGSGVLAIGSTQPADVLHQALDFRKLLTTLAGCSQIRKLEFAAQFEPLDDRLKVYVGEVFAEDAANGGANEFARDGVCTLEFALVFELHLAGDGGKGGVNVGDARDDSFVTVPRGALLGAANETFQSRDGQALADAGAAVHALVFARLESDFFHHLPEIRWHVNLLSGIAAYPGFLRGDGHSFLDGCGVVRANFGANAVFERGDNFPTRGVILGIGGEDDEHVEWQPQRIALNLNVAFLHDVEETDLNFSGKVGKFVNGKDAAVGAWEKAVVDGELVGKVAAAASRANRVDIANYVGHGHVRRGEFFDKPVVARHPSDGSIVAFAGDFFAARAADGLERIVVDFAARHDRHFRIEQIDQATQNAAFGLAAQAEKNEIVA